MPTLDIALVKDRCLDIEMRDLLEGTSMLKTSSCFSLHENVFLSCQRYERFSL